MLRSSATFSRNLEALIFVFSLICDPEVSSLNISSNQAASFLSFKDKLSHFSKVIFLSERIFSLKFWNVVGYLVFHNSTVSNISDETSLKVILIFSDFNLSSTAFIIEELKPNPSSVTTTGITFLLFLFKPFKSAITS